MLQYRIGLVVAQEVIGPVNRLIYTRENSVLNISAKQNALSSATQHAIPQEFGGRTTDRKEFIQRFHSLLRYSQRGMESLNTRIQGSLCVPCYARYTVLLTELTDC